MRTTQDAYGGVGLYRRCRASRLEGCLHLHDLSALHLRGGSALPHAAWLHAQAETTAAGPAPEKEVQAMGTHLAERDGLGTRSWLATRTIATDAQSSNGQGLLERLWCDHQP